MGKEFEKLIAMLPGVLTDAREKSIALSKITPGFLGNSERAAEGEIRQAQLPGAAIMRRFEREGTHGKHWARLKPATVERRVARGFGKAPILVNTGSLKLNAIMDANEHFTLDDRIELSPARLGKIATYLNYGTPRMPARPFYAEFDDRELKPIFERAEDSIAEIVEKQVGVG